MLRLIITIAFFVASLCVSFAQSLISEDVRNNIRQRVDNDIIPGIVVGIIEGDQIEYFSYGVRSFSGKEPVDEHSVFEIGSITKTFTGIILADMVLKGKMKLEDPLQKYLPKGVTAPTHKGESIKLIHLANHTSSLPRMPDNFAPANPANPFADYSEEQMYDFLKNYKLTRGIGSQYEYSNYAVGLLGHIMARMEGKTYEELIVDVIAKPLNLQHTRITLSQDMKRNLAMGHAGQVQVANWDIPSLAGAGALRSTAADMLIFVGANMGNVKTSLYPAMQLSHKNSKGQTAGPMVGLGWHIDTADSLEVIWHNGGTGGYRTFAGFLKSAHRGVVVLTNSIAGADDIGRHLLNPKVLLQEIGREIAVDSAILETYVGKYELAPGFILTVTRDGNQLYTQATGQPQVPVFAKDTNVFFLKVVEAQLTFNKSAQGVVESVTLHQAGRELVGKRSKD